ncbi:MAG: hypothetical protein K2W95_18570 [Candidatus Obscuribacterales bacterium]|nr:hypothetical protein [Candidatus Obscuribacterales bacterium]
MNSYALFFARDIIEEIYGKSSVAGTLFEIHFALAVIRLKANHKALSNLFNGFSAAQLIELEQQYEQDFVQLNSIKNQLQTSAAAPSQRQQPELHPIPTVAVTNSPSQREILQRDLKTENVPKLIREDLTKLTSPPSIQAIAPTFNLKRLKTEADRLQLLSFSQCFLKQEFPHSLGFVDIWVTDSDLPLFVDSSALLASSGPTYDLLREYIADFFSCVLFKLRQGKNAEAVRLLSQLREAEDTHIGFSGKGKGRGMSVADAQNIAERLTWTNAFETGSLHDIHDMTFKIPGISCDKISDALTNIIRKPLIAFTFQQCDALSIDTEVALTQAYWDYDKHAWHQGYLPMPRDDRGRPVLLLPRQIVRKRSRKDDAISHYLPYPEANDTPPGIALSRLVRSAIQRRNVLQTNESDTQYKGWSDTELRATIADYLSMLKSQNACRSFNSLEHYRILCPKLSNKSQEMVNSKHREISAILKDHGLPRLHEFHPSASIDKRLEATILQYLLNSPTEKLLNSALGNQELSRRELLRSRVRQILEKPQSVDPAPLEANRARTAELKEMIRGSMNSKPRKKTTKATRASKVRTRKLK